MIQSIDRAARIMNLLQGARRLGISELAAALELPPSTVHGLVKSLQAHGLVAQEPNGNRYVLGPALLKLSKAAVRRRATRASSRARRSAPGPVSSEDLVAAKSGTTCLAVSRRLRRFATRMSSGWSASLTLSGRTSYVVNE